MYNNGLYALKNNNISDSRALTESNAFVGIYEASTGVFKEIDKYIICTTYLTPLYNKAYRSWFGYTRYAYSDNSSFSGSYYSTNMPYDLYGGTLSIPMKINGTFVHPNRYGWKPELPKGYHRRDMYSEPTVVSAYSAKNYVSCRCYNRTAGLPQVNHNINLTGVIGYSGGNLIKGLSRYVTAIDTDNHRIITVKAATNGTFTLVIPPNSYYFNPVLYISRTQPINYDHFIGEVIYENYDAIGEKLFNIPLVGILNEASKSGREYTSPTLLGLLPDSTY